MSLQLHRGFSFFAGAVALLVACGPSGPQPEKATATAPAARLVFVAPDLSAVDGAVREQLDAARLKAEAAVAGEAAAAAFLRLGQLYHAYDLLEPAAAAYEIALFEAPMKVHLRHGLALVRQRQGRLEEAARLFREVLAAGAVAAPAYRLGQVEKAAQRPAEARAALEKARALDPDCVAATYELALLELQEGKPAAAVPLLESVLARQPSAVQAHFPLGQALQRLGRAEEAQKHLAVSAAREVSVGGRATCEDSFEAELRPLTTGAAAYITRGQIARFAGRMEEALEHYREAIRVAPNDPIAHQALGKTLASQGDLEGALAAYRRATELDPAAVELKVDLGLLLEQKGSRAEAEKLFRAALEKNPALVAAHFGLARLALAAGQADPALASLARVLQLEPSNARARGLRAEILLELRRPEEALADIRHLLDENPPEDPMEHASLAWAAAMLGDKERAFLHLQQITENAAEPKAKAAAHYRLASLYLEKQDPQNARTQLEAALSFDPGLEPARQLLQRLP